MNTESISPANRENEMNGSDSDSNPEDVLEYYQPISAAAEDGEDSDEQAISDDEQHCYQSLSNGISSLHVNEDSSEEEEERTREAADSAIQRAFREDESRRSAPLTAENAMRVIEAMRGISFAGMAPAWADQVPEDQWIDELRRLRQPPSCARTVQN